MKVQKVEYALWAADWERCLHFYRDLFGGEISFASEVWSEIVIAGATIGIHGGGEGNRTGLASASKSMISAPPSPYSKHTAATSQENPPIPRKTHSI